MRSASLRQSIVKRTKQAGLSRTATDSVSKMHRIALGSVSFEKSHRDYPYRSLKKGGGTVNRTELREEKIRSLLESRYSHSRLSALQENPFRF